MSQLMSKKTLFKYKINAHQEHTFCFPFQEAKLIDSDDHIGSHRGATHAAEKECRKIEMN